MSSKQQSLKGYQKVSKPEEKEAKEHPANELLIGSQRSPKQCISQAIDLLESGEKTLVLKGRGSAVNAVVNIAEVVKRRVKGLHQLTQMESLEVTDEYEPKDSSAGLENIKKTKYICGLSITLSLEELDTSLPGYQEPLPSEQVTQEDKDRRARRAAAPRTTRPSSGGGRGGKSGRGGGRGNSRGRGSRGGYR
eukprot:TRINITY_DN24276_c0_g1_i1.p1 TRINITY_DN24276_c0_g1~~TRINITY_DN24276_c0_g1_i1.p1  ORF type:complete len:212 (+),score=42.69 TRINITY_DN24276_c0_g1_i1:60-638(+)